MKNKKLIISIIAGVLALVIVIVGVVVAMPSIKYNKANKLMEEHNYVKANEILMSIEDYKDSKNLIESNKKEQLYIDSTKALESEDFEKALDGFASLDNYKDAQDCFEKTKCAIAKQSSILDWKLISNNSSIASSYAGKWYIFTGIVSDVNGNTANLYIDKGLKNSYGETVYYDLLYPISADFIDLDNDKVSEYLAVTIIGKLENSTLTKAFVFPEELYDDERFIIDKIGEVEHWGNSTYHHYYLDYKIDASKGLVTSYAFEDYSFSGNSHYVNKDVHKLEYDKNNRVIKDTVQTYKNSRESGDEKVTSYTYTSQGFISTIKYGSGKSEEYTYSKDEDGNFVGTADNYTRVYDKDGLLIEETKYNTYTYEYDNGGRLIKVVETGYSSNPTEYQLGVVGIKN